MLHDRMPTSYAEWRPLGATVATMAALSGCGQLAGIDEYRVADTTLPSECGGFAPAEPCGECVRKNCCREADACEKDAECRNLVTCTSMCALDDAECRARCFVGISEDRSAPPPQLVRSFELRERVLPMW